MRVTNIKDIKIKILCFIHTLHHSFFVPKNTSKEMTVYLFTIIIVTLFTLGVTLIGGSKLPKCHQIYHI